MTSQTLDAEPACPPAAAAADQNADPNPGRTEAKDPADPLLRVRRIAFDDIPRATWDALVDRTPAATPFSRWAFHRAWWDAYGANAHDETFVVEAPGAEAAAPDKVPVAIVPLMHRHEVEPTDAATHSTLRHGRADQLTATAPTAKAIFFGASYHADYATILTAPGDLPAVARALVAHLAAAPAPGDGHPDPWDVIDLRRLRCADPAADVLTAAFEAAAPSNGWRVVLEREDVCPVVTIPAGLDFEGYLDTLDKKSRHEIRRKVRRAEAAGDIRLVESADPLADLDAFVDLHQRRWGADGLFPPTPGGDASRVFIRRLFETFGPDGPVRLMFLTIDGRRIGASLHLEDGSSVLYYNAGVDPDARELSPGVLMVARHIAVAIAAGRTRLDFLRGDEGYKYDWGALDEPICRLLVTRTGR
ncbi:MAG: GNAT family N-acetyltransferase [Candidatus Limnocylindrales bacterium]